MRRDDTNDPLGYAMRRDASNYVDANDAEVQARTLSVNSRKFANEEDDRVSTLSFFLGRV